MKNTITKDIQNHLEFIGYAIENVEDAEADSFICRHATWPNVTVRIVNDSVLFRCHFPVRPLLDNIKFHQLFQDIHNAVMVSRWYAIANEQNSLVTVFVECSAYGYDKLNFAKLITQ